jgi:hypothetical protein
MHPVVHFGLKHDIHLTLTQQNLKDVLQFNTVMAPLNQLLNDTYTVTVTGNSGSLNPLNYELYLTMPNGKKVFSNTFEKKDFEDSLAINLLSTLYFEIKQSEVPSTPPTPLKQVKFNFTSVEAPILESFRGLLSPFDKILNEKFKLEVDYSGPQQKTGGGSYRIDVKKDDKAFERIIFHYPNQDIVKEIFRALYQRLKSEKK